MGGRYTLIKLVGVPLRLVWIPSISRMLSDRWLRSTGDVGDGVVDKESNSSATVARSVFAQYGVVGG